MLHRWRAGLSLRVRLRDGRGSVVLAEWTVRVGREGGRP